MGFSEVLQSTFILAFSDIAAAVQFYTCVALQVKKNLRNSAEFLHIDFVTNTPNSFRPETSGHLLCCIIFEGKKKKVLQFGFTDTCQSEKR